MGHVFIHTMTTGIIYAGLTRHITHFMKIEIRPESGIPMCNCAAGKKWKRLVAWFPNYRAKCVADAERNFSRKRNVFTLLQYI